MLLPGHDLPVHDMNHAGSPRGEFGIMRGNKQRGLVLGAQSQQ